MADAGSCDDMSVFFKVPKRAATVTVAGPGFSCAASAGAGLIESGYPELICDFTIFFMNVTLNSYMNSKVAACRC